MIIHVTQNDIDVGHPCKARSCPVALAVQRLLLPVHQAWVDEGSITIQDLVNDLDIFRVKMPEIVKDFISAYDHEKSGAGPALPFSFELPIDHLCRPPAVS